jgi:hypothetical protein
MPEAFSVYHVSSNEPVQGACDALLEFSTEYEAREWIAKHQGRSNQSFFDVRPMESQREAWVSCDSCNAGCCLGVAHGLPPFRPNEAPPELAATLKSSNVGRGVCCWLDLATKRCLDYEHRPQICRDFARGSAACLGIRAIYGIGSAESQASP